MGDLITFVIDNSEGVHLRCFHDCCEWHLYRTQSFLHGFFVRSFKFGNHLSVGGTTVCGFESHVLGSLLLQ